MKVLQLLGLYVFPIFKYLSKYFAQILESPVWSRHYLQHQRGSLLRSRSGRSHVTLPVPTRLLQTDIHSFLGVLRFCLLGPMSLSFSFHCIRCTNHRREHSQQNESHHWLVYFREKECMSVWSSRVGTGSVTWLRPERLRRRLPTWRPENTVNIWILLWLSRPLIIWTDQANI